MRTTVQVLSPEEQAQVHERTLHLLGGVGMRVDTEVGRRILREAGAQVDEDSRMVRFPAELVERSLALAPKRFSLGGRRPGFELPMNAGQFTLLADGGGTLAIDRRTGERRASTHEDWRDATALIDVLDDVGLYWWMCEFPMDPDSPADWIRYWTELFGTFSKHVQDSFANTDIARLLCRALEIVFGGRDDVRGRHPFSFLITPASPLTIEADYTDTWLAMRGLDIPVAVMPMPLMGATAPASRLGTVLVANCETIGTLCLVEAAEPGVPFIYAPVLAAIDPRTGRYAGGAIEAAAMSVAGVEMARHYGLPVEASGSATDHFVPCLQAAYEKAETALLATLAWPDILVGPGQLGGATVLSLEQLVMDVEMFRMARQAHEGVPVADDLWLDDVLDKVGPCGSFLFDASTRRNVRGGEWYVSDFGLHDSFEHWQAAGSPSTLEAARARVDELLAGHRPLPLHDDVIRELKELEKSAAPR